MMMRGMAARWSWISRLPVSMCTGMYGIQYYATEKTIRSCQVEWRHDLCVRRTEELSNQ